MAIVINGSGSISGISVGGLPDGTVDSGTIATGTIVDADVANIAASKLTGTVTSGVQDNITRLGTVTSGALATGVHGKYVLEDQSRFRYAAATSTTSVSQTAVNISGSNYATITTGSSTADLLSFESIFGSLHSSLTNSYMGIGLQRATNTAFSSGVTTLWNSGEHAFGHTDNPVNNYVGYVGLTRTRTVSEWGLAASTTYYFRLIGMTHSPASSFTWGGTGANMTGDGLGVSLMATRWRLL